MSAVQTEQPTLIPTGTWERGPGPLEHPLRRHRHGLDVKSISGRFTDFEGTLEGGEQRLAGVVRTPSVITDNEQRDAHLRSADLLDTSAIPRSASSRPHRARRGRPPQARRRADDQGGPRSRSSSTRSSRRPARADGVEKTLFRVRATSSGARRASRSQPTSRRSASDPRSSGSPAACGSARTTGAPARRRRARAAGRVELDELDLSPIPLYDGDVEAAGDPEAVADAAARRARGRRAAAGHARVQPRNLRSPQERSRLAVEAGARLRAPLEARRRSWAPRPVAAARGARSSRFAMRSSSRVPTCSTVRKWRSRSPGSTSTPTAA